MHNFHIRSRGNKNHGIFHDWYPFQWKHKIPHVPFTHHWILELVIPLPCLTILSYPNQTKSFLSLLKFHITAERVILQENHTSISSYSFIIFVLNHSRKDKETLRNLHPINIKINPTTKCWDTLPANWPENNWSDLICR